MHAMDFNDNSGHVVQRMFGMSMLHTWRNMDKSHVSCYIQLLRVVVVAMLFNFQFYRHYRNNIVFNLMCAMDFNDTSGHVVQRM